MPDKKKLNDSIKFGTFQGVFIPSTEAILGTVLFLLLPLLVHSVGLIPMLAIVLIAHTITIATAFSLSDCATNLNKIGGGGMYALSRKSLGNSFGGSIGIMLYLAQAASIAFYCIGFAEPLQHFLQSVFNTMGIFPVIQNTADMAINILRQKQIIAGLVFIIFFIIVLIGADFTLKLQVIILIVLFLSVLTIFISPFLHLTINDLPIFTDFNQIQLFGGNIKDGVTNLTVFIVFTTFFPAVTGIDAGVGMSGDLKEPKKSLVKGTFYAIGVTFIVYLGATIIFSALSPDFITNIHLYGGLTGLFGIAKNFPFNIPGILILLGILFATSSSALSCFMTAPRTAQSLASDKILPDFLSFLKKDFRKNGTEPRFATFFTAFIALIVILIGEINIAANIVGICFLVVYGWVNGAAFFERISKNPTFRPTIKNHWIVSLYGFTASIIAICLFNFVIGLIIIISQFLLFWLILKYKSENKLEGVWWGVIFSLVTKGLSSLKKIEQGSKNWRPLLMAIVYQNEIIPKLIPRNIFENEIISLLNDENKKNINDYYQLTEDELNYTLKKELSGSDKIKILTIFHIISFSIIDKTIKLSELIASYQGLVNMNIITPEKTDEFDIAGLYNLKNIPVGIVSAYDPNQAINTMVNMSAPAGIHTNSILLEYNSKINIISVINKILLLKKNVFILKNAEKLKYFENIDLWWRGENNGNLMLLLSYIINNSIEYKKKNINGIRLIRILNENDSEKTVRQELSTLIEKSRLNVEILILPPLSDTIQSRIKEISSKADIIMMGLPGRIQESQSGINKFFRLDELFFNQEITKYDDMPPILFVKSAYTFNLVEE